MALGEATVTRVWALEGGTMTLDASTLVLFGQGQVTIPVPTFLIEHDRGLLLYDTGLVPDAADDPEGVYGPALAHMNLSFRPEQRVDRQLERYGFSTRDVTHVVLSHAHIDHAGGLYLFSKAMLFAGEGDLPYAFWPPSPALRAPYRLADLQATMGFNWNLLPGDHDVFGDGAVRILATPGHTPGHLSLLVRTVEGHLLLTGDAVHLRQAWDQVLPMGVDHSGDRSVRSIQRMRRIADATGARVWINHDPQDWARYGSGPVTLGPP